MRNRKLKNYSFDQGNEHHSLVSVLNQKILQMRDANLQEAFAKYEGTDHRLEFVKTINDIDFYDDSQAENPNAVWFAFESMSKPITWIMNITDFDFINEDMIESVSQKVKRIVIQGVYNAEVMDLFIGLGKEIFFAVSMEDAVREAFYASDKGDAILFSPGAPVQGIGGNYHYRGNKFKNAIAQL